MVLAHVAAAASRCPYAVDIIALTIKTMCGIAL
jgi:hypothetical protein